MLESTYDACLFYELTEAGLHIRAPSPAAGRLSGESSSTLAYRVDFIVENCLIVEIKAVEKLLPVHTAQLLSYLKISRLKLGLLINFNVPHLREGIHRSDQRPRNGAVSKFRPFVSIVSFVVIPRIGVLRRPRR